MSEKRSDKKWRDMFVAAHGRPVNEFYNPKTHEVLALNSNGEWSIWPAVWPADEELPMWWRDDTGKIMVMVED